MSDHDLKKIDEMFQHRVGILNENFQHKLDIERHQMLEIIERKLKPLFWDYVVDPAEAYDVLMGRRRQAGPFDRERLLIRMLERLPWYDLLELLGPEGVKSALTPEIIQKLRFSDLKERYEFIRRTLHAEPVSFTRWNPENRARVGAAFLSHRRYGAQ